MDIEYEKNYRIFKYTASLEGDFNCPGEFPAVIATFTAPNGIVLDYGFQENNFVMWMHVHDHPDYKDGKHIRILVPTGGGIPKNARYSKTFVTPNSLVYHMFVPF